MQKRRQELKVWRSIPSMAQFLFGRKRKQLWKHCIILFFFFFLVTCQVAFGLKGVEKLTQRTTATEKLSTSYHVFHALVSVQRTLLHWYNWAAICPPELPVSPIQISKIMHSWKPEQNSKYLDSCTGVLHVSKHIQWSDARAGSTGGKSQHWFPFPV